jgi:hypothetical protein
MNLEITLVSLGEFLSFDFIVLQRYVIAALGEKGTGAYVFFILLLQLFFCHVRSDGGEALETDGVERSIFVAAVREERSGLKGHRRLLRDFILLRIFENARLIQRSYAIFICPQNVAPDI